MRRKTIYLVGIMLVLFLAIRCVANAAEPVIGNQKWVLLYKYPTADGGVATYLIDSNLPNITSCWEIGKMTVAQVYHRNAFYECISLTDFQAKVTPPDDDDVIDFYDIEE